MEAADGGGLAWPAEPMLAKPTDELPAARSLPGGCLYELKWDGYRALIGVDSHGYPHVRSRRGHDITRAFADVATAAAEQLPRGSILDGELVVWNDGQLDFGQLQRRWQKLRIRSSIEALVGAITGTIRAPDRLILGLPDANGDLRVVGTTAPLKPGQRDEVAALLEPMTDEHPWPEDVPAGDLGAWTGKRRLPVTRVNPTLVVEIEADAAYEHHFRHLATYLRARPDLLPEELSPL